jgi:hypothetical protein
LKHSFFDGYTHNAAAVAGLGASGSNKNLFDNNGSTPLTNTLGSSGGGNKLPGSRAMRIESRKGILSRKSSVNKNSFYKQKSKDTIPNKLYGSGSPGGISGMGTLSGVNRGASSYFNKNNPNGAPGIGSSGGINKNSAIGNRPGGM